MAKLEDMCVGSTVSVGIHSKEGSLTKKVREEDKGAEPLTVLDVAEWNEFGLGVPERSFIRAWFDGAQAEGKIFIRKMLLQVVAGRFTPEQAYELIGLRFVGQMQQRIADGIEPPNAASTIAKKGSSKPLIDTGQLRSSITYVIEKDK